MTPSRTLKTFGASFLLLTLIACDTNKETSTPPTTPPPSEEQAPAPSGDPKRSDDAPKEEEKEEEAFFEKDSEALSGQLVFIRNTGSKSQVVLTNANDRKETVLITKNKETEGEFFKVRWSEDKSLLTMDYLNLSKEPVRMEEFTMKPDGSEWTYVKQISESRGRTKRDSRDRQILVNLDGVFIKPSEDSDELKQIYKNVTAIGSEPDPKFGPFLHEASWGPNKKHVTFERFATLGLSIYIVNTEGKIVRKIARAEEPDWK